MSNFKNEGSRDSHTDLSPIDLSLANCHGAPGVAASEFADASQTTCCTPSYERGSPSASIDTSKVTWMGGYFDFIRSKRSESQISERGAFQRECRDEESGMLLAVLPNSLHTSGAAILRSLASVKQVVAHWITAAQASEIYNVCQTAGSNCGNYCLVSLSARLPVGVKSARFIYLAIILIALSLLSLNSLSSSSTSTDSPSKQSSHPHGRSTILFSRIKTEVDFSDEEVGESNETSLPVENGVDTETPPPAPTPLTEESVGTDELAPAVDVPPPPPSLEPRPSVASHPVAHSEHHHHHDLRYMYLKYDSPQGVKMFDCEQFPQPDHKVLQEWHYVNTDGSPPPFYKQQIRHQSNAFISCPASRPRIVILRGKFGRVFGTNQKTGEPVPYPYEYDGEYTEFEFSTGLREKCQGFRFCCINRAEWHFNANEIGLISWYCEEGPTRQEGESVQHGSMVIYQSEMAVLANLNGTDSYAKAAIGTPRVEAEHPLPPTSPTDARCTMSLHQSVHMYFGGQGAGLIHQISSLTAAIGMAAISKCDVNSEGFYPDFDLLHPVPLGLVIDLNHWNQHLELQNFDVKIVDKIMDTHLYPFTTFPHGPPVGSSLNDMMSPPQQLFYKRPFGDFRSGGWPHQYTFGHMFPFWMFEDTPHLTHLRNVVVGDLQFTPPFRNAASAILKELNFIPGEFIVIHFRLEADTKEFAFRKGQSEIRWRENMFSKIVLALQDRKIHDSAKIYLSTGLNSDDGYVQRFKSIFPNAMTKDMIMQECKETKAPTEEQKTAAPITSLRPSRWDRKKHPALYALSRIPWTSHTDECGLMRGDEYENREYWALLDWLVARESKLFIGTESSMFSKMMDKLITFHPRQWWAAGNIQSTFFLKDD